MLMKLQQNIVFQHAKAMIAVLETFNRGYYG